MTIRMVFAIIILALCCSAAMATPTFYPVTGYVLAPDAHLAPADAIQVSAAYVATEGESEFQGLVPLFPCHGRGFDVRGVAGLSPKAEAGIGWLSVNKDPGSAGAFSLAAKYQLYHNLDTKLAVAAGLMYSGWSSDMEVFPIEDVKLPSVTTLYVVADKEWENFSQMGWKWTGTIGLAFDSFSATQQEFIAPITGTRGFSPGGEVTAETFLTPFLGLKTSNGDWTFLADLKLQQKNEGFIYSDTAWSLAARKSFSDAVTATAGLTSFNIPYSDAQTGWFLDISYQFPK